MEVIHTVLSHPHPCSETETDNPAGEYLNGLPNIPALHGRARTSSSDPRQVASPGLLL